MKKELITLGKRIAELREKRGLTQEKLAELIGYSTNHISKLEIAGTNPSFELLLKLSTALNIEIKDFFETNADLDIDYMKDSLTKIINSSDNKKIKLLYKIFRSIDQ